MNELINKCAVEILHKNLIYSNFGITTSVYVHLLQSDNNLFYCLKLSHKILLDLFT